MPVQTPVQGTVHTVVQAFEQKAVHSSVVHAIVHDLVQMNEQGTLHFAVQAAVHGTLQYWVHA